MTENEVKLEKLSYPLALFLAAFFFLSGCASDKGLEKLVEQQAATLRSLNQEVERLNAELDRVYKT